MVGVRDKLFLGGEVALAVGAGAPAAEVAQGVGEGVAVAPGDDELFFGFFEVELSRLNAHDIGQL